MNDRMQSQYIGYYKSSIREDIVLAMSESKKWVKQYLEDTRGLSKDEYLIEKKFLQEGDELYGRLEDFSLIKWEGYKITVKDYIRILQMQDMVESNWEFMKSHLQQLEHALRDQEGSMSCVSEVLSKLPEWMEDKKVQEKLLKETVLRSSVILSKNIHNYLGAIIETTYQDSLHEKLKQMQEEVMAMSKEGKDPFSNTVIRKAFSESV